MIAAAVALAGCKTREVVVTEHHTDTLRLVQHHRDSIYLHDSTFVREYIQGDTVRIITEMWHTKYRDRLKTDTLYRSRTDSVPVPYPVIKEVKKPLTMIEKGLMGTGIGSIVGILFYCIIIIRRRLP
jgi:acetyl-CoA carboxylase beta subunit